MNIYNLRYFVTLARIRQYTKAAEELCITQPSLSHAISQMEKELGVKLFEKNGHKITLTQFGEEFLSYAEKTLDVLDDGIASIKRSAMGNGTIRLGLVRPLGISYVPEMAAAFIKKNTKLDIDFTFHTDVTGRLLDDMQLGNHNVLKIAQEQLEKNPNHSLFVLGELGRHYFEQRGIEIEKQFHYTVQNPTLNRARNISEEIIELYRKGELDEVYIIYTSMINAIQEETQIEQLLPLKKADFNIQIPVDFKREELALKPSPEVVMDRIVPDYIVGFVYGALVESFSCEQNARMMAMEAASKSAKDMLHDLDIQYNRARQASITQEITEVIAGAKSQKKKRKK